LAIACGVSKIIVSSGQECAVLKKIVMCNGQTVGFILAFMGMVKNIGFTLAAYVVVKMLVSHWLECVEVKMFVSL
jgi:hypothetical protein